MLGSLTAVVVHQVGTDSNESIAKRVLRCARYSVLGGFPLVYVVDIRGGDACWQTRVSGH